MKTYKEQSEEIRELCKQIILNSDKFASETKSPYFGDLLYVISELKELNSFLK